jgi:hypothetical protein
MEKTMERVIISAETFELYRQSHELLKHIRSTSLGLNDLEKKRIDTHLLKCVQEKPINLKEKNLEL